NRGQRVAAHDARTRSSASFARVKLIMPVSEASGRLIRCMPDHWASRIMVKASYCPVTLRRFVAAEPFFGSDLPESTSEPFCEACAWSGGVLAGLLALQSLFRCAATRQLGRQKRADRRSGLNLLPQ